MSDINEKLDAAIERVLGRIVGELDAVSLEKLANAAQSLTYSKWQHMQPDMWAREREMASRKHAELTASDAGRALAGAPQDEGSRS